MLYTDCQSGKTAAISRHVNFAQITSSSLFTLQCSLAVAHN